MLAAKGTGIFFSHGLIYRNVMGVKLFIFNNVYISEVDTKENFVSCATNLGEGMHGKRKVLLLYTY